MKIHFEALLNYSIEFEIPDDLPEDEKVKLAIKKLQEEVDEIPRANLHSYDAYKIPEAEFWFDSE